MKKIISSLLVAVMLAGCARHSKTVRNFPDFSTAEARIGEVIHQEILKTMTVYQNPELNEYVRSVGEKIAAAAHRQDLAYRFVILEDDRIYSIHAPGGYVYLTTGFFKFLHSEIELAGILSHEVAMLQYKDPDLSKLKRPLELLIQTGSQVAPAFGSIGAISMLGLVLIGHFTLNERPIAKRLEQADEMALDYMVASGYDPQGLIDPLIRMSDPKSEHRTYLYDYLQSHPVTPERMERLDRFFQKLSLENKEFNAGRETFLIKTETVRNLNPRK